MLLLFGSPQLRGSSFGLLESLPYVGQLMLQIQLFAGQLIYVRLKIGLALFRLEGFPHPESYAAAVERLVRLYGHPHLVSDPQQEQTPLRAIHSDLSDDLVETLRVEFSTNRANAGFTRLDSTMRFDFRSKLFRVGLELPAFVLDVGQVVPGG